MLFRRICQEDEGVLTFEWILLITVLIIGIVGGLSATRDALITELGDVAEAAVSVDQSYTVTAGTCGGTAFGFADPLPQVTESRSTGPVSQTVGACGENAE